MTKGILLSLIHILCVQHCQAWCMYYGEAADLVKKMDGDSRWALFTR